MTTNLTVFKLICRPLASWAVHWALVGRNRSPGEPEGGRFTEAEVKRLLGQSWRAFDGLVPGVSRESTFGSRLNLRLAALTLAMLRTLAAAGIERNYAIELIGDMCWNIRQYWGRAGKFMARLFGQTRLEEMTRRARPDGSWPMSFPFNPPGYRARYVPTQGGIGFDAIRFPVAEYFQAYGSADLAVSTWCMLDYPLAEMLNMRLMRSQTLAGGGPQGNFRWFATTADH